MNWDRCKQWLEYLAGATDEPPPGRRPLHPVVWAGLWAALIALVLLFSGQTSRFIYIDF